MSKWRINLVEIGRGKVSRSVNIDRLTLPGAEQAAIRECEKHLIGSEVILINHHDLTYTVGVDGNDNGKVFIRSL